MAGIDIEYYQKQTEGTQLVAARNAQYAVRKGLPDRDTARRLRRREAWREFRYEAAEKGFFPALRERFGKKKKSE